MSEYRAVSRRRRTKQIDKFLFLDAAHTVAPSFFFHLFLSFPLSLTRRRANLLALTLPHLTLAHFASFLLLPFLYHHPTYPRGFIIFSFSLWPLFLFLFFFSFFRFFPRVCCFFFLGLNRITRKIEWGKEGRKVQDKGELKK